MALQLRPNCELCDIDLHPDSMRARICTYECTFCVDCVETKLHNVCPNCGGGFVPRPIRPKTAHRRGISLAHQPASKERVNTSKDLDEIAIFAMELKDVPPEER